MLNLSAVPPSSSRERKLFFWLLGAVVLLGALIYHPVRHFEFLVLDDSFTLRDNPWLPHGLSWPGVHWAFLANLTQHSEHAEYWSPLTLLSRLLDAQLFGMNPGAFHVTSALLHCGNALLVALALHRLTGAAWRSGVVALLFLVHPQNVEPVCWLAARKDLLSATFYLCTLLAYGWYAQRPTTRRYAMTLLAYSACLAAKPMGVSLPFVLLILDWWPLRRLSGPVPVRRLLLEKLPFLLLAIGAAGLAVQSQADWGAVPGTTELPLIYRVQNAVVSYSLYVRRLFWPGDLAIYYPHPGKSLTVGVTLLATVTLVGITTAAWFLKQRAPALLAGWLWFGIVLGPVIGLMQIGAQGMADRYFYLSGLGLMIAVVWLLAEWVPRRWSMELAVGAIALAAMLAVPQVRSWQGDLTVFPHAVAVTHGNSMAHLCLGTTEMSEGRRKDARVHLHYATAISPSMSSAWETLGRLEVKAGDDHAAIKAYAGALGSSPKNTGNMVIVGCLLKKVGEPAKAEAVFRHMQEVAPQATSAFYFLGDLYADIGRWPEAREAWQKYLASHPGDVKAEARLRETEQALRAMAL